MAYENQGTNVIQCMIIRDNYNFFSNPRENVRQPKALPDIDMLLFYTIRHNREIFNNTLTE